MLPLCQTSCRMLCLCCLLDSLTTPVPLSWRVLLLLPRFKKQRKKKGGLRKLNNFLRLCGEWLWSRVSTSILFGSRGQALLTEKGEHCIENSGLSWIVEVKVSTQLAGVTTGPPCIYYFLGPIFSCETHLAPGPEGPELGSLEWSPRRPCDCHVP